MPQSLYTDRIRDTWDPQDGGPRGSRGSIISRVFRDPRDMIAIVPQGSREIHNLSYLIPLTQGPEGPGGPLIPNVPRVPRVPAGVPRVPTEAQKLLAINHTNADAGARYTSVNSFTL